MIKKEPIVLLQERIVQEEVIVRHPKYCEEGRTYHGNYRWKMTVEHARELRDCLTSALKEWDDE